jgi:hypothetical protein
VGGERPRQDRALRRSVLPIIREELESVIVDALSEVGPSAPLADAAASDRLRWRTPSQPRRSIGAHGQRCRHPDHSSRR